MKLEKVEDFLKGAKGVFPELCQSRFSDNATLVEFISNNKVDLSLQKLLSSLESDLNKYDKSLLLRIFITANIISASESNTGINIKEIWKKIYESLMIVETDDIIASVGSQGFLAIPLFRIEKESGDFYFLRLHIWSSDIDSLINSENKNNLRIHTHQFFANSWILCGEVFNTRYIVTPSSTETKYTLFDIKYNNSDKNKVKNNSIAINSNAFMNVEPREVETYSSGGKYNIEADHFHMSEVNTKLEITSTVFLFSHNGKKAEISRVLGPAGLKVSEINRLENVNFVPFLSKIDQFLRDD